MKCSICGNLKNNKEYMVRERQINKYDELFKYILCPECGTLQLVTSIHDMAKYYDSYYAFDTKSKRMILHKLLVQPFLFWVMKDIHQNRFPSKVISKIFYMSQNIYNTGASFSDSVLDVGGNGFLAGFLKKYGFNDVICIDLYGEKNVKADIDFYKCSLIDLPDKQKI